MIHRSRNITWQTKIGKYHGKRLKMPEKDSDFERNLTFESNLEMKKKSCRIFDVKSTNIRSENFDMMRRAEDLWIVNLLWERSKFRCCEHQKFSSDLRHDKPERPNFGEK